MLCHLPQLSTMVEYNPQQLLGTGEAWEQNESNYVNTHIHMRQECTRTITLACIFFFQIILIGTLVKATVCSFCKLITVQAIWMKLHTVVEHNETMRHVQEQ